jgi:hypothetical protein
MPPGLVRVSAAGILASDTDGQVLTSRFGLINWETPAPIIGMSAPWGDGSDGDYVIAGAEILFTEQYYDTVSFGPAGVVDTASVVLRCLTLDLRGAQAGAIVVSSDPMDGGDGFVAPGTAGPGPTLSSATLGGGWPGAIGGEPVSDGPDAGAGFNAASGGSCGNGGTGGIGGDSATQFGGNSVAPDLRRILRYQEDPLGYAVGGGLYLIGGGSGGAGGAGSATRAGGGGGGGDGVIWIVAREIIVDATTAAGAISSRGGNGGNGGATAAALAAGAGGAGGGAAGWIYLVYQTITGTRAGVIETTGGNGGNGGDGGAGGVGGDGGAGGGAGSVTLVNMTTAVVTDGRGAAGAPGGAAVGNVGGAGGAGAVYQVGL